MSLHSTICIIQLCVILSLWVLKHKQKVINSLVYFYETLLNVCFAVWRSFG